MKLQSSDKVAGDYTRPRIKKGYYEGELIEVKLRQDKDGNPIEGKYGKQLLLLFRVYENGKAIVINDKDLVLASVQNIEYGNKDGTKSSALTPNSRVTKVFKILGWAGPPAPLETDEYLGRRVELNIDDIEMKKPDGEIYKASVIKDINKLEGTSPSPTQLPTTVAASSAATAGAAVRGDGSTTSSPSLHDVIAAKKKEFDRLLAEGSVTKQGYDIAMLRLEEMLIEETT